MPDLAGFLLRKSLHTCSAGEPRCSSCGRSPVPGELVSVFEGERALCALCVGALPEPEREPLRRERVHASSRQLAVGKVARAA